MLFCCKNKSEAEDILKILKREHKNLAYVVFFKKYTTAVKNCQAFGFFRAAVRCYA